MSSIQRVQCKRLSQHPLTLTHLLGLPWTGDVAPLSQHQSLTQPLQFCKLIRSSSSTHLRSSIQSGGPPLITESRSKVPRHQTRGMHPIGDSSQRCQSYRHSRDRLYPNSGIPTVDPAASARSSSRANLTRRLHPSHRSYASRPAQSLLNRPCRNPNHAGSSIAGPIAGEASYAQSRSSAGLCANP